MKEELISNLEDMTIENGILLAYRGKSKVVVLPKEISRIGIDAFANREIESVLLPEGLVSIESGAFRGCKSLKTIKIPHGVVQIADSAFSGCTSLGVVVIPESVLIIGNRVFASHKDDMVIVAKKDSFAYKYALERKLKVCEDEGALDELIRANNYLNNSLFYREVEVFGEKIRVSNSLSVCTEIMEHYKESARVIAKRIFAREHTGGADFITDVVSDFVLATANRATERGALTSGTEILRGLGKAPMELRDGFLEYQAILLDVSSYEIDKKHARDKFEKLINAFADALFKAEIECLARHSIVHRDAIFGIDKEKALEIATPLMATDKPSEVSIGLSLKYYPNNPELIKHALRCGKICDGLIDLVGILNINLVGDKIYALVDRQDIFGITDMSAFVRGEMDKIIKETTWEKFTKRGVCPAPFAQVNLRDCYYRDNAIEIIAEVLTKRKETLDSLYERAVEFYSRARSRSKLADAIVLFRKIEFYGDSKKKISEIQDKISRKKKTGALITVTAIVLVIALVISAAVYFLGQSTNPIFEDRGTYYAVVDYRGFGKKCVVPAEYEGKPVTVIGNGAFEKCVSLEYLILPEGLISIGMSAFQNCYNLEEVVIPDSLTNISQKAFSNCISLESIFIPGGVERIEYGAFQYCGELENVVISDGVVHIGDSVFSSCSDLERIVIPASVTNIGNFAFSGCTALESVIYQGTPEDFAKVEIGEGNKIFVERVVFLPETDG